MHNNPKRIPKHIVVLYDVRNAMSYIFPQLRNIVLNVSKRVIVTATPKMFPIFLDNASIPDNSVV